MIFVIIFVFLIIILYELQNEIELLSPLIKATSEVVKGILNVLTNCCGNG